MKRLVNPEWQLVFCEESGEWFALKEIYMSLPKTKDFKTEKEAAAFVEEENKKIGVKNGA